MGAGDQGMMIGFACNETPELMPLTISLAHRLCRQLALLRKSGELPYLRPDGKSQVTVEYEYGRPKRIDAVVISTQHDDNISTEALRSDVLEQVIKPILPPELVQQAPRMYINPTGRFVIGGPMGDAGLTGRKIIVDSYGGIARHGGGAFSGKDPTKVDRSGAYAARYVAKNIVAGGARRARRGPAVIRHRRRAADIDRRRDVRHGPRRRRADPRAGDASTSTCGPRRSSATRPAPPDLPATAAYGHFGRDDIDAPWERTDKAAALAADAGHRSRACVAGRSLRPCVGSGATSAAAAAARGAAACSAR